MFRPQRNTLCAGLLALCTVSAHALQPLVTDDTGTQGQGGNAQGKAGQRKRGGKAPASRMNDAPLREPSEYGAAKPTRQPVVINKRDLVRTDRFPTPEQLEELELSAV